MTESRRKKTKVINQSSRPISRRLRRTTRLDYCEDSDSTLTLPQISAVSSQDSTDSAELEYDVRSILQQRRNTDGGLEYLVDWADHPTTGKKYSPSWEPRENVSSILETAWLQQQQQEAGLDKTNESALSNSQSVIPETILQSENSSPSHQFNKHKADQIITTSKLITKLGRPRRVIESSPSVYSPVDNTNKIQLTTPELSLQSQSISPNPDYPIGTSDEAEVRASLTQAFGRDLQKLSASLSFSPSSINHSAEYQPANTASAETAQTSSIVLEPDQHSTIPVITPSQASNRNITWSTRRDEAQLLTSRLSHHLNSSIRAPRRFSQISVIPDSQPSSLISVESQSDLSNRFSTPVPQTGNQPFDDNISSTGHIPQHTNQIPFESHDPIIPETQSQGLLDTDHVVGISSPWPLAQLPLSEAQLQQHNITQLSPTQNSGHLACSEDEGFGGSEPEESSLDDNIDYNFISEAQQFAFSLTVFSIEDSSQVLSTSPSFHDLPQSTHPVALQNSRLSSNKVLPKTRQGLRDTISEATSAFKSFLSSPIAIQSTMRGARGVRSGPSASQTEDGEAATPRKSLRGMRKEVETQRAQIKARTQKATEQDESKPRSPESETPSSNGATKGRGRKKKEGEPSSISTESIPKPNGASINGDIATKTASQQPRVGPKMPNMQFIIPMPLVPQAGDQYRRTVVYNKVLIETFTATNSPSSDLVKQAEEFVQTMRNICMHLDLATEEDSLSDVLPSQQMTWDRSISSKFHLLGTLLENLQSHDLTVVIFASPGKVIDIVEKFVIGNDVNFSRPDLALNTTTTQFDRLLKVVLLPSQAYDLSGTTISADIVVALDHRMDVHQPQIRSMRLKDDRLAPVIFLVVLNSIDHVDKVMAPSWKGEAKLRTEIACLAKLRANAGRFNGEYQSLSEVGKLISEFVVKAGAESDWPVAPIGPLADNESWDLATGQTILVNQEGDLGKKRSRDSSVDREARNAKKVRVSSAALENTEDNLADSQQSASHVSESDLNQRLGNQSSKFLKIQEELKSELAELKAIMTKKDAHNRDLEKHFDKQMDRFEVQTRELEGLRRELEEAKKNIDDILDLKSRRDETIVVLKDENRALKTQLQEAFKTLEGNVIPEIAELARLRREKAEAEEAADKAAKQAAAAQNLSSYLQDGYRKASDHALEVGEQNDILGAKVKELERIASGEANHLQKATISNRDEMTIIELRRLRVELKNTKAVLTKKEEELKSKRGGIGTRAGSVPRSPRVGPSSRATSPIPDRRIENLRNNTFTGRGKAKNPRKVLDAEDRNARAESKKKEVALKGANRSEASGGEPSKDSDSSQADATMVDAGGDPKLADIQPAQPTQPPATETKNGPPTSRPFPCCFAQYNCNASFTSKNEWKRHISTKHIQIGFWRCDMCNPSPGLDHPVYNDFNRKDLFTQHLRRMHAPNASSVPNTPNPQNPGTPIINVKEPTDGSSSTGSQPVLGTLTDDQISEIQKRCFKTLRAPPHTSSCVFCSRVFTGPSSWEERLEHVGGHMERDRKNGTNCLDIGSWKEDLALREYLVTEGIVEQDQRENWRIGDGRPRRPLNLDMPSTPGTLPPGATLTFGSNHGDGSDEAMSKRRRGRPPKMFPETDDNRRLGPGTPVQNHQAGMQDTRSRLNHTPSQLGTSQTPGHAAGLSPHPTSEMRGPSSAQSRNEPEAGIQIMGSQSNQHQRLEPYPPGQFLMHHSHTMPQNAYASESSPSSQRSTGLANIMPRTAQNGQNQGAHSGSFGYSSQPNNGQTPISIAPAYHHQQQMHAIAPAPSRVPTVADSNHNQIPLNQYLAQQMAQQAMISSNTGGQPLAPAPPRANQSPSTAGHPYYQTPSGSAHYAAQTQDPHAFSQFSQGQNMTALAEPSPVNDASSSNGLLAQNMQSQIHPDFLDEPDRPPSVGDNRAKTFREVTGIEKDGPLQG